MELVVAECFARRLVKPRDEGYIALVPEAAEDGDVVAVISGMRTAGSLETVGRTEKLAVEEREHGGEGVQSRWVLLCRWLHGRVGDPPGGEGNVQNRGPDSSSSCDSEDER